MLVVCLSCLDVGESLLRALLQVNGLCGLSTLTHSVVSMLIAELPLVASRQV